MSQLIQDASVFARISLKSAGNLAHNRQINRRMMTEEDGRRRWKKIAKAIHTRELALLLFRNRRGRMKNHKSATLIGGIADVEVQMSIVT
jgi:hypothetical protein